MSVRFAGIQSVETNTVRWRLWGETSLTRPAFTVGFAPWGHFCQLLTKQTSKHAKANSLSFKQKTSYDWCRGGGRRGWRRRGRKVLNISESCWTVNVKLCYQTETVSFSRWMKMEKWVQYSLMTNVTNCNRLLSTLRPQWNAKTH